MKSIVYHHKLLSVVLAAFLTTAALTALVSLPWFAKKAPESVTIAEQDGVYDLTGITDFDGTVIRLAPGTAYYPNTYLTPENADAAVPESTGRFAEIRADYLSQRFVLLLPENSDTYTLTFKLSGRHAMRVYVNGRQAAQTGRPGTTKQDTEVWENSIVCDAAAKDGKMDVILQSAQFYHAKRGASLAELSLSRSGTVSGPSPFGRIKGVAVTGALLCAAALLLGIYLLLSHTEATLYFALACVVMALREFLQSQAWTYFPMSGNLSFMLEYLSVVLLTVFLSLYLGQYATGPFLRAARYTAIIGSCAYGVCVLLGDSVFYTSALKYYQILLVLCIVPGITVLFRNMRDPTREQTAALYGIAVFFLAALSDIAMYSDIFGDRPNAPLSETAMLVFVLAQTFSLFLMNNRVLTEAKEAGQKLAAEKAALESLDRMKTEFLGNVSHELKTPLAVISGYAQNAGRQLLTPKPDAAEAAGKMKIISSEAKRLGLMVGQILDVTRIEEGRMNIEAKVCGADELIDSAISAYYPMLNKNNNRLDVRIDEGLPDVLADPARISQVLVNLISNAVRFTANGRITVSAKEEGGFVAIRVADTGSGISRELLPFIFDRYVTRQKSGGGQDTGTGLGLYICRYIAEAHGGTISVESEEGKGTTFRFTLPVHDSAINTVSC